MSKAIALHWPTLLVVSACCGLAASLVLTLPLIAACAAMLAALGVALGMDGTIKRLDQFSGRGSARETPRRYLTCNTRDILLLFTAGVSSETVDVKYRGPVDQVARLYSAA